MTSNTYCLVLAKPTQGARTPTCLAESSTRLCAEVLARQRVTANTVSLVPIMWPNAPFPVSIRSVVFVCSHEKMVWANTGRVVAMMTDVQPLGDRSIRQGIGHPVRPDRPPRRCGCSGRRAFTIACGRDGTRPQPAAVGFLHLAPEPVLNVEYRSHVSPPAPGIQDGPAFEFALTTPPLAVPTPAPRRPP